MDPRASGYVTEIGYTLTYTPELAPRHLALALLNGGVATRAARPLRYLELGFGQGLSLAIHAAASPGEYWGVDINPEHVAHARAMAEASGSRLELLEAGFEDIVARPDLPEFDVIVANGIWSWVSAANRAVIVDIVRRKLARGGMLYLSYNCTPGWSAAIPLRHLMSLHADLAAASGKGILDRIDGALDFAQRVADADMGYFKQNPAVVERLSAIRKKNRVGVAHEFFNADWEPMPFSQVAGLLAPAGASFAVSGNLVHHLDGISMPPAARELLAGIDHPILRESVRDYVLNANFRRDIFVKDGARMPAEEQRARYLEQGFVLARPAQDFRTPPGGGQAVLTLGEAEITMKEDFYKPLIDVLAEGSYAPKTLRDIAAHARLQGRALPSLVSALVILAAAGIVRPAQDAQAMQEARPRCEALNAWLIGRPPAADETAWLASPVTGSGVSARRSELLFLQALRAGHRHAEAWTGFVRDNYPGDLLSMPSEAGPTAAPREKLAALAAEAKSFAETRLPMLEALGVV